MKVELKEQVKIRQNAGIFINIIEEIGEKPEYKNY